MNRHVKRLLVVALVGAGLVTGVRAAAPAQHAEASVPANPGPAGSCC